MPTMLENALAMIRGELPGPGAGRLIGFSLREIEPGRALCPWTSMSVTTIRWALSTAASTATSPMPPWAWPTPPRSPRAKVSPPSSKTAIPPPVRKGPITAEGKVIKAGSTLGYVECDVLDGEGRLVARASSTCIKIKPGNRPGPASASG